MSSTEMLGGYIVKTNMELTEEMEDDLYSNFNSKLFNEWQLKIDSDCICLVKLSRSAHDHYGEDGPFVTTLSGLAEADADVNEYVKTQDFDLISEVCSFYKTWYNGSDEEPVWDD